MKDLIAGITIYSPDIDVTSRMELSRGTMLATGTLYATAYCETAFNVQLETIQNRVLVLLQFFTIIRIWMKEP